MIDAIDAERRAADAWEQMIRTENPMPSEVGLDYVQEVTDDRVEAAELLLLQGYCFLRSVPAPPEGPPDHGVDTDIRSVAAQILDQFLRSKGRARLGWRRMSVLEKAVEGWTGSGRAPTVCEGWRQWHLKAVRVFDILNTVWVKSGAVS